MITAKQLLLLGIFSRQPYKEWTYRELKEQSKEKSNSLLQKTLVKFQEEQIMSKKKIGNIFVYSLILENPQTLAYLNLVSWEKLPAVAKRNILVLLEEISSFPFCTLVIFGSYAEGKQKDKSDLDVMALVKDLEDKRKVELSFKEIELKSVLTIDGHVFTTAEMLEMLKDKKENLGKQIAKKHLVIHNPAIFYNILKEGINNLLPALKGGVS